MAHCFYLNFVSNEILDERGEIAGLRGRLRIRSQIISSIKACPFQEVHRLILSWSNMLKTLDSVIHVVTTVLLSVRLVLLFLFWNTFTS